MQLYHKDEVNPNGSLASMRGCVDCDRQAGPEHIWLDNMVDASGAGRVESGSGRRKVAIRAIAEYLETTYLVTLRLVKRKRVKKT